MAGIELIFFLVAGIVFCFGFSMRRMLIATTKNISVLSNVYSKVKDFSASHPQPARKLEGHKKLAQDTARAPDPNRPKGYFHTMVRQI